MKNQVESKTYDDYYESSKLLFGQIFGNKTLDTLQNIPAHSFDFKGEDVKCGALRSTCLGIKQRFSSEELRTDDNMLELFIRSVFHYGFEQCYNTQVGEIKLDIDTAQIVNVLYKSKVKELEIENEKFKEELEGYMEREAGEDS